MRPGLLLRSAVAELNPVRRSRGHLDFHPVSSPQVGPGPCDLPRLHGRHPQQRWAAPQAPLLGLMPREGLPMHRYRGLQAERHPSPAPRCPLGPPGAATLARAAGTPATIPDAHMPYRSGLPPPPTLRDRGGFPPQGAKVASSPRPRRQRWSLVPAASALDAGADFGAKKKMQPKALK